MIPSISHHNRIQNPWWRGKIKNIRFPVYLILCHINHTAFKLPDFKIAGAISLSRHWVPLHPDPDINNANCHIQFCYSGYSNYCLYPVSIVLAACCNALLLSSRDKWYLWIFDPYSWQLPLLHMSQVYNGPTGQNQLPIPKCRNSKRGFLNYL